MVFTSTDKNKKILEKYTELWKEIKNQIKTISGDKFNFIEPMEYEKDFMKIRFESANDLPLGKVLNIPVMVLTGSVLQEDNAYYPQAFWYECVYKSLDKL